MKQLFTVNLSISFGTSLYAHDAVNNTDVMKRMTLMKGMASEMKILGGMMKREIPFDSVMANNAVSEINRLSSSTVEAFSVKADDPKSEAKSNIWDEFENFTQLSNELTTATSAITLDSYNDLRPAMGMIGKNCKACHSKYKE